MFVESNAIEAKAVHFLPGFQMLRISAGCDFRIEVASCERVGQFAAILQVVKFCSLGHQIKYEDLHGSAPAALKDLQTLSIRRQQRRVNCHW